MNMSGVHLWLLMWKAGKSLEAHAFRSIEALGMCPSDFAVLEALLHKGPLPVNTIGKKVLLTSGSMTAAIDRLTSRGLVERRGRRRSPRPDRSPTNAGRKFIAKFAEHERGGAPGPADPGRAGVLHGAAAEAGSGRRSVAER
jgi:MarR family 2-MHQ and catechol resistance regulon transcriptional repressor